MQTQLPVKGTIPLHFNRLVPLVEGISQDSNSPLPYKQGCPNGSDGCELSVESQCSFYISSVGLLRCVVGAKPVDNMVDPYSSAKSVFVFLDSLRKPRTRFVFAIDTVLAHSR